MASRSTDLRTLVRSAFRARGSSHCGRSHRAYQGESEGEPHGLEDATHRTEHSQGGGLDLTTRHDARSTRSESVRSGICGSGGYVLAAAAWRRADQGDRYRRRGRCCPPLPFRRRGRQGGRGAMDRRPSHYFPAPPKRRLPLGGEYLREGLSTTAPPVS